MPNRRRFLFGSAAMLGGATAANFATLLKAGEADSSWPRAAIEIVDDSYGIPHIRAASISDAFFGQGYATARDRLFQLDLSHRREMGLLSEVFGQEFVGHDTVARLFHYRGDLNAELRRVPANIIDCARGYIAGINARIDAVEANPSLLPLEYRILGVQPMRWALEDLVIARGSDSGNVDDEIRRAQLAALGLLDLDQIVAPLSPAWTMHLPNGLDAAAISPADLGVLRLPSLPFGRTIPTGTASDPIERGNAGSNAWTVAGSRTASGRPILANDPHLGIGGFGPRYVAHLSAPGLDVIGGGAPGLPGIMQGHTDRFAFGRTNFHIDQEDLFVLELDPTDPERYRHDNGWKAFMHVQIAIPVRGKAPQRETLRYSVHGAVVSHDAGTHRAAALASIAMAPGGCGAFAMIAINLASDWASLRRAFHLHPSPTNFHYADVAGNSGWQAIGFVPVRKRGDGLLPVPGDGRYDWTGYRDFAALPHEYNPAKGWFASANQNNLPPNWPRDRIPAFSFREPYRYNRIADVLASQPRHTIADSIALQHDTLSTPARQLIALLPNNPTLAALPAARMLGRWDGHLDAASAPAALFEIVWRELSKQMLAAIVPDRAKELITQIAPSALLGLLTHPNARLGVDPIRTRDALINDALATAWRQAQHQLGPDPAGWRWGTLHQIHIAHPLAHIPAIAAAFPPIEGLASGGDSYTVMARWVGSASWRVGGGASYLQVIDVGKWDNSVMLLLPGESNDPRSPHYRDDAKAWNDGAVQPMLFSRTAIDAHAERRITLPRSIQSKSVGHVPLV